MPNARRGEVWMVDLGMVAKVRPAVIISVEFLDHERAVYAVMPHTTAVRGTRFEAVVVVPWLERGAFDAQGIRNIPRAVLMRRLGSLSGDQMKLVEAAVRPWFGLV